MLVQFDGAENGIRAYPDGPPDHYPLFQNGRWLGGYVRPAEPDILVLPPADGPMVGFAVRGADGVWHDAKATWEGFTLAVWSPEVKEPEAVSYAWASNPKANAYGTTGLPVMPFRSDSPNPPPYASKRK
jgi:sialate O-acetylesterase